MVARREDREMLQGETVQGVPQQEKARVAVRGSLGELVDLVEPCDLELDWLLEI